MSQLHFLARQLVGAAAHHNADPALFEKADGILEKTNDYLASTAWKAYKQVRTSNPVAIAAAMARLGANGVDGEVVSAEILSLATRWTEGNAPIDPWDEIGRAHV